MKQPSTVLDTHFGEVRYARVDDAPFIVELVAQLARHHDDQPSIEVADLIDCVFCESPWAEVLVAEKAGEIVGYVALLKTMQLQFGSKGFEVHHLFTHDQFRGLGIGQCLIEASKVKAAKFKCDYLTVGTHADNYDAQAFYRSLGFDEMNVHPPRFRMAI